jgi:cation diffusion facilitator CzcD-associated flavoprotein CzcO
MMERGAKGTVAIIGAGISGLAAARYLQSQSFSPSLFESHDDLGGQWNRRNGNSGVWPEMRTNTARFVTKLSDVQYPDRVAMFPRNGEVLAMINAFADMHDLRRLINFGSTVEKLTADLDGGYSLTWTKNARGQTAHFDKVVVASGRFNKPEVPDISGLDGFAGDRGVVHAFHYKQPESYRGKRVVVGGSSISALEIASDLSMIGTERVYLAQRRQRYVMPKMIAGTPLEYFAFTRAGGLAVETTPKAEMLALTKEFLLKFGGDPARYGAPAPHPDMEKAGVTGSQHFLNLVAEDRIDVRPWISNVAGKTVYFADGTSVEADAIILGTGFDLNLPFLSEKLARTVNYTGKGLHLSNFTFHPDLPNLAFMGLWAQLGPYPVVLEQQARYIAYAWSGAIQAPTLSELRQGVADCIGKNHHGDYRQQHEMALRFAALAGTDPGRTNDPELLEILAGSAVTGEMFRILGTDALSEAEDCLRSDFWRYAPPEVRASVGARHGREADGSRRVG